MAKLQNTEQTSVELQAFRVFDKRDSGVISTTDLGPAMRSLGLDPTKTQLLKMVREVDPDETGLVDFQEFLQLSQRQLEENAQTKEGIMEAFKVLDKDGDGIITALELRHAMTNLGEKWSEKEVDEMIEVADTKGDGKINYEEFATMMTSQSEEDQPAARLVNLSSIEETVENT